MRINDVMSNLSVYQNNQANRMKLKPENKVNRDTVDISADGKEISQTLKSGQAGRQQRIEQLKEQISNGAYKVDGKKVSDSMLAFWKN